MKTLGSRMNVWSWTKMLGKIFGPSEQRVFHNTKSGLYCYLLLSPMSFHELEPDWEGQEILCILQIYDIYNSIAGSSQKKLLMDLLEFMFFHRRKISEKIIWAYQYIQQLGLLLFQFHSMDSQSVFSHPLLSSGKSISFLQIWPILPRSFGGGSVANSTDVCGMTPQPELLQVHSWIYAGVCG